MDKKLKTRSNTFGYSGIDRELDAMIKYKKEWDRVTLEFQKQLLGFEQDKAILRRRVVELETMLSDQALHRIRFLNVKQLEADKLEKEVLCLLALRFLTGVSDQSKISKEYLIEKLKKHATKDKK